MWSRTSTIVLLSLSLIASSGRADDQVVSVDPVLIADSAGAWKLVRAHCTSCHSSQIFKNVRLSRTAWEGVIKRMQNEEGLWDLGENEPKILDYLTTFFGLEPVASQRRSRRAPIAPATRSPNN